MNWDKIKNDLIARADDPRCDRLWRLVRRHAAKMARRKKAASRVPLKVTETHQWRIMREALRTNRKIIAFDSEWQYQYPNHVTEIGLAIFDGGTISVHNIRVLGKAKDDTHTRYMSSNDARAWLNKLFRDAGLLVGHAIENDRKKMKEWQWRLPDIPCVDTAKWSQSMSESNNSMRLKNMCIQHGVEVCRSHIAGNDALMTLKVALKLAEA